MSNNQAEVINNDQSLEQSLEKEIKVIIPNNEIQKKVDERFEEVKKIARIPGYRPNKAPMWVIKKRFGDGIFHEVVQKTIDAKAEEIVKDEKLASRVEVDVIENEEGKDISFSLKFEVLPEFDIPNFDDIEFEKPIFQLEQEDIATEIQDVVKANLIFKEKEGAATKDDRIVIDIEAKFTSENHTDKNKNVFSKDKLSNIAVVLKEESFLSNEFHDKLVDCNKDDELTFSITYPEEYEEKNMAGKTAEFKVKVHGVQEIIEPEVNEEFVQKLGYQDLESFYNDIKTVKKKRLDEIVKTLLSIRLFNTLEKKLSFNVPKSMLEKEINTVKKEINHFKDFNEGLKEEELEEYINKLAIRRIRIGFLLNNYAEKHSIKITQEDLQEALIKQINNYPPELRSQLINFYQRDRRNIELLSGEALESRVINIILDKEIKLIEKQYSITEVEKLIEEETNLVW